MLLFLAFFIRLICLFFRWLEVLERAVHPITQVKDFRQKISGKCLYLYARVKISMIRSRSRLLIIIIIYYIVWKKGQISDAFVHPLLNTALDLILEDGLMGQRRYPILVHLTIVSNQRTAQHRHI